MNKVYAACAILLLNLISFSVTVSDKAAAKKNRRRVPERAFLLFAAFFGGAGVLTAFYAARHKTRHYALLAKTWILSVLSYAVLVYAYTHLLLT